ncbi:hypothetical protein ACFP81_08255 [Deinococcus lacus]|uniref:Uncharacterized protein n=1 Tax=Deinococcus lacus TaxID=392561 RepID=A0ABW1YCF5_9DEIO
MSDDFGYSLEDRELFLEFLKTGTVWGIYYGMPESKLIEKFGNPDEYWPDEANALTYKWFNVYTSCQRATLMRVTDIQAWSVDVRLFGLKLRNESDASRILTWLKNRDLLESHDAVGITLRSGVYISYQIRKTKNFNRLLHMDIEGNLPKSPNTNKGYP